MNREKRLVQIEIGPTESVIDSVFEAAEEVGISIRTQSERMNDAIDGDSLETLFPTSTSSHGMIENMVIFELWGQIFRVTPAVVEVYEHPKGDGNGVSERWR
jgi:hypothetical protein